MTGTPRAARAAVLRTPTTAHQRRKLHRLLADAIEHVPFYRQLYGDLGISAHDLDDPRILERLPVLSKADLLSAPPAARRNTRFDAARLAVETTTGSTGQPFAISVDSGYKRRRNLRFLRALIAVGYRPWQRLMLLTDRYPAPVTRVGRRSYVSVEQPTDAILEAYLRIRPAILYGLTTPLRLLAERIVAAGPAAHRPQVVVSTAEMLDPGAASALGHAFRCPVHDFYGLTEMGLVAWKRDGACFYNSCTDAVLTEFVPAGSGDRFRMIMTNLDLRGSPVIRFDSGDLASIRQTDDMTHIESLEGRQIDTIRRGDGTEISPYRVTDALRDIAGLERFKVTQCELDRFRVDIQVAASGRESASAGVATILQGLLGSGIAVECRIHEKLVSEGTRKFRPVESQVPRR